MICKYKSMISINLDLTNVTIAIRINKFAFEENDYFLKVDDKKTEDPFMGLKKFQLPDMRNDKKAEDPSVVNGGIRNY